MSRPVSRRLSAFAVLLTISMFSPQVQARTTSGSTTNADGTTTSITKNADGTTTRTVTSADGQTLSNETLPPEPVTHAAPREHGTSASTQDANGNTVAIKKNPDGTTTRTVTTPDGRVVESGPIEPMPVTKAPPHQAGTSASTTNADGTTTTITKNPDGTTTRTVTAADGTVISSAPVEPQPVTKAPPHKSGSSASTTDADGNTVTIELGPNGTRVRSVTSIDGKLLKREALHGPITDAQLIYDAASQGDITLNTAMVLKASGDKLLLEVSALATGKGTEFRTWVPESIVLLAGKDKVKPTATTPYYVAKESAVGNLAPALFAVIGARSAADVEKAKASPGTACSQSSESGEAHEHERGKVARAIDEAGMAAGMTLLASQAKGQIEGRKAVFDVTQHAGELLNSSILFRILNTEPTRINIANAPREIQMKVPAKFTEGRNLLLMVKPTVTRSPDNE